MVPNVQHRTLLFTPADGRICIEGFGVPAGRVVSKQVVPPLTNSSKMHALSAEEEEDEPTDSTFEENTKQTLTPGSDVVIAASIAATSPGKTNASEIHVSSVTAQAMECHRQQPSDTIVCTWKATTGLRVRDGRISIIRRCYDTQVKEYWRTQLHQPRCHTSCNVHANCNGSVCVHHAICMSACLSDSILDAFMFMTLEWLSRALQGSCSYACACRMQTSEAFRATAHFHQGQGQGQGQGCRKYK